MTSHAEITTTTTTTLLLLCLVTWTLAFVAPLATRRTTFITPDVVSRLSVSRTQHRSIASPLFATGGTPTETKPSSSNTNVSYETSSRGQDYYNDEEEEQRNDDESWLSFQQATFGQKPTVDSSSQHSAIAATTKSSSSSLSSISKATASSSPSSWFSEIWKARFLLFGAAALYGTNFSVVKILDDELPVGIAAAMRFGIASLCTLPWLLAPPKQDQQDGNHDTVSPATAVTYSGDSFHLASNGFHNGPTAGAIACGLEVGLWNSVGYLAQAVGLQTTDASKSAFLCSLAVVIVPLLEFATGKRLQARELWGAAMAVVGVGFLELGGSDAAAVAFTQGDLASLLQPLAFGIAFWRMETAMRKYPNEANRNAAAQVLAVFCVSMLFCFVTERDSLMNLDQIQTWLSNPSILGALFWTGSVTTALTVYMEAVALKTLSAAETTVLLSAEPLFGAFFASLLIGETFGVDAAIGAGLIVAGCLFSNLGLEGILGRGKEGNKGVSSDGKDASYMNLISLQEDEMSVDDPIDKSTPLLIKGGLMGAASSFVAATASTAASVEELELVEEVIRSTSDTL